MTAIRKFFCFELETITLFIGYFGFFSTLSSLAVVVGDMLFGADIYLPIIIIALLQISVYGSLIHGVLKRNHFFLLPWLIPTLLPLVMVPFMSIYSIFMGMFPLDVVFLIGFIAIYILSFYIFLAVFSLYCKFRNERKIANDMFMPLDSDDEILKCEKSDSFIV